MRIEQIETATLSPGLRAEIVRLCDEAYGKPIQLDVGPGHHFLGFINERLVSHLMIVTRWLQPRGLPPLRTAYVELVATAPAQQGRGYATHLLRYLPSRIQEFDLGALSPSDASFYARSGWELWRGPLFARTGNGLEATPNDDVMIYRLARTPRDLDVEAELSVEWRAGEIW